MYGYIIANQEELKLKDYKKYRSFYCGLCHTLGKKHGVKGQITLSYEMTFLSVLLNALYEEPLTHEKHICMIHPAQKHDMLFNEITEYAADMEVLLAYYKALDNWHDERDVKSQAFSKTLAKEVKAIEERWPRQSETVRACIEALSKAEVENDQDIDKVAGYTGKMLGELFVYKKDMWSEDLRRMGFYLGKFVYLMDAFEDIEKDVKKKNYNIWLSRRTRKDFDALVENTLTLMLGDCARIFEVLPIVQDIDILRNILYSGVWIKYNAVIEKRAAKGEKNDSRSVPGSRSK